LHAHTASLLTFEKYHYVWDTQRLGIDPCIHVFENISRKLTVHLLCSNILPSILGHDVSGKKSLVRDPARFKTHESSPLLQGTMSEADTMLSFVIPQVMQNAEPYHNVRISESGVLPKRLRVPDYKGSLGVRAFGGSDTSWIDVEPDVIDLWKPR
jgi:hypothetical protein